MDIQVISSIKNLIFSIIEKNLNPETVKWLRDQADSINNQQFNLAFASIPRKTGKKALTIEQSELIKIQELLPGFSIKGWTTDRLCRVWLLMHLKGADEADYINKIETLFTLGEMNELVALYSSLPFFSYPEAWRSRCSEGVRSNIGLVLEAIMYQNPYPAEYLEEAAWNQLVMKAFFTDKDVSKISGLDERANRNLSLILFDYARERYAAHRKVPLQLWRLTTRFIDASNFSMIERLFTNGDDSNRRAAALVCSGSSYEPARQLLNDAPELKNAIHENSLNWMTLIN